MDEEDEYWSAVDRRREMRVKLIDRSEPKLRALQARPVVEVADFLARSHPNGRSDQAAVKEELIRIGAGIADGLFDRKKCGILLTPSYNQSFMRVNSIHVNKWLDGVLNRNELCDAIIQYCWMSRGAWRLWFSSQNREPPASWIFAELKPPSSIAQTNTPMQRPLRLGSVADDKVFLYKPSGKAESELDVRGRRPKQVNGIPLRDLVGEEVIRVMNERGDFDARKKHWHGQVCLEAHIADFVEQKQIDAAESSVRRWVSRALTHWKGHIVHK